MLIPAPRDFAAHRLYTLMFAVVNDLSPVLSSPLSPSADSKAIVDGNLKLILGMIWTLILHYSISMPMWEDEDDEEVKNMTPKQRLLGWIQNKVPQLPINNFHRDWRDGKALGALVDNCAPGKNNDSGSARLSRPSAEALLSGRV